MMKKFVFMLLCGFSIYGVSCNSTTGASDFDIEPLKEGDQANASAGEAGNTVEDENRTNSIANFDLEGFKKEKAAWEARGIRAYSFAMQMALDMPVAPVRITVKGAGEPEIEFLDPDFMCPDSEMSTLYGKTIQGIYDSIEKDIEKYGKTPQAGANKWVEILIEYDPEHHYPRSYSLCHYYDDLPEPGGSVGFEISAFEIGLVP